MPPRRPTVLMLLFHTECRDRNNHQYRYVMRRYMPPAEYFCYSKLLYHRGLEVSLSTMYGEDDDIWNDPYIIIRNRLVNLHIRPRCISIPSLLGYSLSCDLQIWHFPYMRCTEIRITTNTIVL